MKITVDVSIPITIDGSEAIPSRLEQELEYILYKHVDEGDFPVLTAIYEQLP